MHRPLQLASPAGHDVWQVPAEQAVPEGHALPHPPQFWLSDWISTQVPLPVQKVEPSGQLVTQAPLTQV
jgi:hypothetical protein